MALPCEDTISFHFSSFPSHLCSICKASWADVGHTCTCFLASDSHKQMWKVPRGRGIGGNSSILNSTRNTTPFKCLKKKVIQIIFYLADGGKESQASREKNNSQQSEWDSYARSGCPGEGWPGQDWFWLLRLKRSNITSWNNFLNLYPVQLQGLCS